MNDEYGKQYSELPEQPPEVEEYSETQTYSELPNEPKEIETYAENYAESASEPKKTIKKKNSSGHNHILSVMSAVLAVVVAVTIIVPAMQADDPVTVEFQEMVIKDDSISYFIVFDNWSGKSYDVVVSNYFTERVAVASEETVELLSSTDEETDEETVTSAAFMNDEKDLKPGVTYTLSVRSGSTTIASTTFRTLTADEMPVTELNEVQYSCACETDGTFHILLDYVDENGWWDDFKATLTDADGNVSTCEFSASEASGIQQITVSGMLTGETATLKITCTSSEDVEDGGETKEITLLESEVEI